LKGESSQLGKTANKHEIPVGTLRSILSQAHITPNDWDELG
jgi:nucleoside phosphorylase